MGSALLRNLREVQVRYLRFRDRFNFERKGECAGGRDNEEISDRGDRVQS